MFPSPNLFVTKISIFFREQVAEILNERGQKQVKRWTKCSFLDPSRFACFIFKLGRVSSNSLKMSYVGEFLWGWILGSAPKFKKKEKEIVVVVFTSSIKRSRRSRAMTEKMCTKECAARAKLLCTWPSHLPVGCKLIHLNLLPLFVVFVAVSNSVVVPKVTNFVLTETRRERLKQSRVQWNFLFLLWLTFVAVPRSFLRCP